MDTLKSAIPLMKQDCWFASIDLKDAFYSIPVAHEDRKYLRFLWDEKLFHFTCLPMGLTTSPRVFTKVMKPVLSYLRKIGHSIISYIDDSLLQGDNYEACVRNISDTVHIMDYLGLTIHPEKSVFLLKRTTIPHAR